MPVPSLRLPLALALGLATALPAAAQDIPRGLAGAYLAARHASMTSDFRSAAAYYGRAIARDRHNPQLLEAGIIAQIALGRIDRAAPYARSMDQAGHESQIANIALISDMLKRGAVEDALAEISGGRSVGPLVDALTRAWGELALGSRARAIEAFDRAEEETGLGAFAQYHKALALAVDGDYAGADRILSGEAGGGLRLTRRGVIAHAQILSELGRNTDALGVISESFGSASGDPGVSALRARLEAGERVPFTLIDSPAAGLAEVFYTVAGALNGEASDSYTLLYARVAQYLRPDHVDAILLAAGLLEAQERYALATEVYNLVPRDDPAFHAAELGRAAALRRSGRAEAAIEALEQLAETHADLPIVHTTLGDTLRARESYDAATEAYDRAIALFEEERPEQWVVYYTRGITHEREGRWEQAEADFRKALELNPGQPQVLNYLGYSFVEMETNLDEALEMIEEAVAAEPESGYIVDSLGWVLYRLGRYDEAVVHMERAAELMPVDPIVNDHLGDVYWAVGRETEARFQWRRALSFDPEPEEAERIRRKLEVGLDAVLEEEGAEPLAVAGDGG